MFNADTKELWYGLLKSKKGSTPVVFNPKLPEPPRNQLYLYNAEKDAVVVYVKEKVEALLVDYDSPEAVQQAEKDLKAKCKEACKEFLKERGDVFVPSTTSKTESKKKPRVDDDADIQIEEAALDGEEWLDEDM
ncbi:MAG TPA: hypothetical protein VFV48_07995 [Pseudomonadales bacterium]|nr:hypothetical protein [Pseudomonadales bacterium]